jgi:hypothetical protein
MRQYVGTVIFGVVAVAVGVVGWFVPDIHQSWLWSLLVAAAVIACLIGAYLLHPSRKPSSPASQIAPSAFIKGDADGSTLQRVKSNADDFITGNARRAFLADIKHKSRGRR